MIYLGYQTNIFDFYTIKTLKYRNFLNISNWDKTKTIRKLKKTLICENI